METEYKLSNYCVYSPIFSIGHNQASRIIYSTLSSEIHLISDSAWNMVLANKFNELNKDILASLIEGKFLVDVNLKEFESVISLNNSNIKQNKTLYYVIQPTANCQFGCNYCGQQHTSKTLLEEDQNSLLVHLESKLKNEKYEALSIGWFGAEPLLGLKAVSNLSANLIDLAERYECLYEAKIVTNGYLLTKNICRQLLENKIYNIEITLDGTNTFHDKRRFIKGGFPTFSRIISNINEIAASPELDSIKISIRCNVDKQNYEDVENLILLLAKYRLQNRISFYTAPIHSWGNDAHLTSLEGKRYAELEIEWLSLLLSNNFDVSLIPSRKPVVCMAVQEDSIVVDAYGNVFNCTEVPYVKAYEQTGDYKLGNLAESVEYFKKDTLAKFNEEILNGDYDCNTCKMLPVCGGACPKSWKEGHIPCPSTKSNIENRLLLFYANKLRGTVN